jgi:hypothetical protein
MTLRLGLFTTALVSGLVIFAGCGAPAKEQTKARSLKAAAATTRPVPTQTGRLTVNDPCPTFLHDLCGPLLLYLTSNYRLPESLDELRQVPGSNGIGEFACPLSKRPYVYNREGVIGANVSQRAVVYDAAPDHSGYRWAIVVKEATPNAPFIAEVVAWPESRFPKNLAD